jgi:hypothetical protein
MYSSTRSQDHGQWPLALRRFKLYRPKPTASSRIPLHIHDRESSDKRTGRSAHTTTLLGRWVITLRPGEPSESWLLFHHRHRRRRRRRPVEDLVTRARTRTRTRTLGISPLLLSACCIWRGRRTRDHVWGEDVVECYAAVVWVWV